MTVERETCNDCGLPRFIVNKKHGLCGECNHKRLKPLREKQKSSINKVSVKQSEINKRYKAMCIEMDNSDIEKVCSGCGSGSFPLSHSHLISKNDCVKIGRPELIYDPKNVVYHCMSINEHTGCHDYWHSNTQRINLLDYQKNIEWISEIDKDMYMKYKVDAPIKIDIK